MHVVAGAAVRSPVSMITDEFEPTSRKRLSTSMPLIPGRPTSRITTSQSARSLSSRAITLCGSRATSTSCPSDPSLRAIARATSSSSSTTITLNGVPCSSPIEERANLHDHEATGSVLPAGAAAISRRRSSSGEIGLTSTLSAPARRQKARIASGSSPDSTATQMSLPYIALRPVTRSGPPIGMFMSTSAISGGATSASFNAAAPSAAVQTSKPTRESAFDTVRRTIASSSAIITRMLIGSGRLPGLLVFGAELRAQALDRAPQQLTHARRRDPQGLRDLLVREVLDIVQAEDRAVALLEVSECGANTRERQAMSRFDIGRDRVRCEPCGLAVDRTDLDVDELGEPGAIRVERDAERVRDALIARRRAILLELADRGGDLAGELADPARHDVAAAKLVADRAADPVLREREERLLARAVVTVGRFDQPEHPGRDDVLAGDPVGAAARHAERDPASGVRVLANQTISCGLRRSGEVLHERA